VKVKSSTIVFVHIKINVTKSSITNPK